MKITLLMTLLFGLVLISTIDVAEKTPIPQRQKVISCNQQASVKAPKGDERETLVSQYLKGETITSQGETLTPQQQEMSNCNKAASAKSLRDDKRSALMSTCLKKA